MDYETVKIEKTSISCKLCADDVEKHSTNPPKIAILSCEGACSKGEIARQAANLVAFRLAKDNTARICLGGAFTKQAGPRDLVSRANKAVVIEGCPIACATRMMKGVLPGWQPETVLADTIHKATLPFSLGEASESQLKECARVVAETVVRENIKGQPVPADRASGKASSCCK